MKKKYYLLGLGLVLIISIFVIKIGYSSGTSHLQDITKKSEINIGSQKEWLNTLQEFSDTIENETSIDANGVPSQTAWAYSNNDVYYSKKDIDNEPYSNGNDLYKNVISKDSDNIVYKYLASNSYKRVSSTNTNQILSLANFKNNKNYYQSYHGINCASFVSIALQKFGVFDDYNQETAKDEFSYSMSFYGTSNGYGELYAKDSATLNRMMNTMDVVYYYGNHSSRLSAYDLKDYLEPGDIVTFAGAGHTTVFAGYLTSTEYQNLQTKYKNNLDTINTIIDDEISNDRETIDGTEYVLNKDGNRIMKWYNVGKANFDYNDLINNFNNLYTRAEDPETSQYVIHKISGEDYGSGFFTNGAVFYTNNFGVQDKTTNNWPTKFSTKYVSFVLRLKYDTKITLSGNSSNYTYYFDEVCDTVITNEENNVKKLFCNIVNRDKSTSETAQVSTKIKDYYDSINSDYLFGKNTGSSCSKTTNTGCLLKASYKEENTSYLNWISSNDKLYLYSDAIQDVATSYYNRGTYIQYDNFANSNLYYPEDATSDSLKYSTCSYLPKLVYNAAFGIVLPNGSSGYQTFLNNSTNEKYKLAYKQFGSNVSLFDANGDGNMDDAILGSTSHTNSSGDIDYYYISTKDYYEKFKEFIGLTDDLEVGDIITIVGGNSLDHTLMVYDLIYSNNKVVDVYLMEISGENLTYSSINDETKMLEKDKYDSIYHNYNSSLIFSASNISYNSKKGIYESKISQMSKNITINNTNVVGAVSIRTLSDYLRNIAIIDNEANAKDVIIGALTEDNTSKYNNGQYYLDHARKLSWISVVRPLVFKTGKTIVGNTSNESTSVANVGNKTYTWSNNLSDYALMNLKFKGIEINTNSDNGYKYVQNGDEITYTVTVKNNGYYTWNNTIIVAAEIGDNAELESYKFSSDYQSEKYDETGICSTGSCVSTVNGETIDKVRYSNGKMTFARAKIPAGKQVTLTYTVKVTGNAGNSIVSNSYVYGSDSINNSDEIITIKANTYENYITESNPSTEFDFSKATSNNNFINNYYGSTLLSEDSKLEDYLAITSTYVSKKREEWVIKNTTLTDKFKTINTGEAYINYYSSWSHYLGKGNGTNIVFPLLSNLNNGDMIWVVEQKNTCENKLCDTTISSTSTFSTNANPGNEKIYIVYDNNKLVNYDYSNKKVTVYANEGKYTCTISSSEKCDVYKLTTSSWNLDAGSNTKVGFQIGTTIANKKISSNSSSNFVYSLPTNYAYAIFNPLSSNQSSTETTTCDDDCQINYDEGFVEPTPVCTAETCKSGPKDDDLDDPTRDSDDNVEDNPESTDEEKNNEEEQKSVTITFNNNGGTCTSSSTSLIVDSTYGTLPTCTKSGYTFIGWYTALTGGTKITTDTKITSTSNYTIYARYEAQQTTKTLKERLTSNGYKIKSNYVYHFSINTNISTIKNKIGYDVSYTTPQSIITTGTVFKYNNETYTAIIYGDLNGDGLINSADLLKMRQHLLGTSTLTGAYKEAASIANGITINSADLLRIRQHLLGTYLITQ